MHLWNWPQVCLFFFYYGFRNSIRFASFLVFINNTHQYIICGFNQLYYLTPLFLLHHEYFYRVRARWVMHEDRCVDFFMSFCWFLCSIPNFKFFVLIDCWSVFIETRVLIFFDRFMKFLCLRMCLFIWNMDTRYTQRSLLFLLLSKLLIK